MASAGTINFTFSAIAFILLMSCILFLSAIGNKTETDNIPLSFVKDNKERTFLIEGLDALSPTLILLLTISGISILSVFFFVKRINKLKKETSIIAEEQNLLVNNLEETIIALEDSKEEAYRQHLSMKRIAMVLSHDLQSPFRFLVASTETLCHSTLSRNYEEAERISLELKKSGEQMLRFLMDFTVWIKSISGNYVLRMEAVDVPKLIDEMKDFFSEQLKCRNNTFIYESNEQITILTDKEVLKIVIRNIIDNANKNCANGIIRVEVEKKEKYCTITIEDDGKGMTTEVLNKIKDTISHAGLYPFDSNTGDKQGYKFIAHFAHLLHIETDVNSRPQSGTKITLDKLTIA